MRCHDSIQLHSKALHNQSETKVFAWFLFSVKMNRMTVWVHPYMWMWIVWWVDVFSLCPEAFWVSYAIPYVRVGCVLNDFISWWSFHVCLMHETRVRTHVMFLIFICAQTKHAKPYESGSEMSNVQCPLIAMHCLLQCAWCGWSVRSRKHFTFLLDGTYLSTPSSA